MKKLVFYMLLATLIWALPALATNLGQQTTRSATETRQAIAAQNQASEKFSPTDPSTAMLLGAGLIGLVVFSRYRVKE
jgi:hypothetical protein